MDTELKEKIKRGPMTYIITYVENGVDTQIGCSKYSLQGMIKTLEMQGAKSIIAIPNIVPKNINEDIIEKRKFYYYNYNHYYREYKLKRIDQNTFNDISDTLRTLKKTCVNKEDFEEKFEEYKNTLTK